jgi:hypothetical protein
VYATWIPGIRRVLLHFWLSTCYYPFLLQLFSYITAAYLYLENRKEYIVLVAKFCVFSETIMIQHGRPWLSSWGGSAGTRPIPLTNKKKILTSSYAYPCQRPKQHAAYPPALFPTVRSSGCYALTFPHRWPRRTLSLSVSLTCIPVTCAAHSLAVRPSPIAVGCVANPAMAAGTHVSCASGLFRPSQGHPRAWSVLVVLARHRSLPDPTAMSEIDRPRPSPPLYCKCMFQVFQIMF